MYKKLIDLVVKGDLTGLKKAFDIKDLSQVEAEDLLIGATIGGDKTIVEFFLDQGISS